MAIGCDQSIESNFGSINQVGMAPIIIPAGATIESATLNVFVNKFNDKTVNVHRITSDWEETVVTWNNFGGAYDANVEASFLADAYGWESVDITSLFSGWANGSYPNYGLLLDIELQDYPRVKYNSRENAYNHAYLEVCYNDGSGTVCVQEEVIADTYVWELYPDLNQGTYEWFYTGWSDESDKEKQALLKFEIEAEPQEGCSHTIGYWKTHAGFGPQDDVVTQYLPITLGDGSGKSLVVTDAAMAVDVLKMKTYGKPKNGITKLYAQMLGSKLSIADGASDADIASTIADADAFLAMYDWNDWKSLSKDLKKDVLNWMSTFDQYNNGYIGPGHCDEFDPDGDYTD